MSLYNRVRHGWSTAFGWVRLTLRTVVFAGASSTVGALLPGPRFSQWLFKGWCERMLRQIRCDLQVSGLEHVQANAPCVLVANHLSALDIPVLGAVLEGDYRWVAKRELFRIPFVGWHLWSAGHIPVDRKGGKASIEDLQRRFGRRLQEGASILLFPEGTRSEDGELQGLKMGAFYAAVRANVPLVPIVADGAQRLASKGALSLDPDADGRVVVRVLAPVQHPLTGSVDEQARALRDATHAAMHAALVELRGTGGLASAAVR
jgi:1-acyl-sn-glycerol-3-phosphate acyltransferase